MITTLCLNALTWHITMDGAGYRSTYSVRLSSPLFVFWGTGCGVLTLLRGPSSPHVDD